MTAVEVGLLVSGLLLLVGIWQVGVSILNERKRTQPIVVTHEDRSRGFDQSKSDWRVEAHMTNEGQGAAFNVRFGVAYFGVRFAFRLNDGDPPTGNRHRVLQPRTRVPDAGSWPIFVPSQNLWAGKGVPEEGTHFYWARYENAQGKVWETRNPPDRSADLDIRRIYFVGLRERWEARRRDHLTAKGREVEQTMLRELREGMKPRDGG